MRNVFDRELNALNNELITMGALCEEAISAAAKMVIDSNESLKQSVLYADSRIDQKERDIEDACMKLLMRHQPVAKDLRTISSALKMISDMERIGDQASDIAEIAKYVSVGDIASNIHIKDMAQATIKMVTDSIDSFVKKDIDLAYTVIEYDDNVDRLFDKVKAELIESVEKKQGNAEGLIDLLMIAKYLERIGDHAENIAQWVIFSITGKHTDGTDEL